MRCIVLSLVVFVAGCQKSGSIELDTGASTFVDSGTTDSFDSGTLDTGVILQDPIASFVLDEVTSGSTFALTWVNLMGDTLEYGETAFSSTAEAGVLEVYLPLPPAEEMIPIEPDSSWLLAFYVPSIHQDTNGDGTVNVLETIHGVGEYLLFFSNLSIPDYGVEYGWNSFNVGEDLFLAPFNIPLEENLHPNDSITINGRVSSEQSGIVDGRLAAIPVTLLMGLPVAELMFDENLDEDWTVSVESAPPVDHFQDSVDLNSSYAVEYLAVYDDDNSNYSYDLSDEILTGVCRDGRSMSLVYLGAPRDLAGNVSYAFQGMTPGWYAMESWVETDGTEKNELVSSPESLTYEVGEPCWLDND
jgi:hypothetical protein